jgi:ubiquinone/menaquinone biosynthesis C-methylase UbiE
MFSKLLAKQLSGPSQVWGQLIFAPMWNRRNAALNDLMLKKLALQADDRVLEIGFGGGYLLGQMLSTAGFVAGVDVSGAMVDFCEKRYRRFIQAGKLDLKNGVAENLPYEAGRFTKVCSVNSIFYWQDAKQALEECWRVLRGSGQCFLCFTSRESLSPRSFSQHGLTLYEGDDIARILREVGFGEISVEQAQDRHRIFWCVTGMKSAGM